MSDCFLVFRGFRGFREKTAETIELLNFDLFLGTCRRVHRHRVLEERLSRRMEQPSPPRRCLSGHAAAEEHKRTALQPERIIPESDGRGCGPWLRNRGPSQRRGKTDK